MQNPSPVSATPGTHPLNSDTPSGKTPRGIITVPLPVYGYPPTKIFKIQNSFLITMIIMTLNREMRRIAGARYGNGRLRYHPVALDIETHEKLFQALKDLREVGERYTASTLILALLTGQVHLEEV